MKQEQCSKYVLLIFHLIKSYFKMHNLPLFRSLLQNSVNDGGAPFIDNQQESSVEENRTGNGSSMKTRGVKVTKVSVPKAALKISNADLKHYKNDMIHLGDFKKHIRGFQKHLERIIEGQKIDNTLKIKLLGLKYLSL